MLHLHILSFLILFLGASLSEAETRQEIELEWKIPESGYRDGVVFPGDTVTFSYMSPHDVYYYPSGECSDANGAVEIGASGGQDSVIVTYEFTEEDVGMTKTFVCTFGIHCESGQKISFKVNPTPEADYRIPAWNIGNAPYETKSVYNGQTVHFTYSGSHNVVIFPEATDDDPCDDEGLVWLGETGEESVTYAFTEGTSPDPTEVMFACFAKNQTAHCEKGQHIKFNVYATIDDIPSTDTTDNNEGDSAVEMASKLSALLGFFLGTWLI